MSLFEILSERWDALMRFFRTPTTIETTQPSSVSTRVNPIIDRIYKDLAIEDAEDAGSSLSLEIPTSAPTKTQSSYAKTIKNINDKDQTIDSIYRDLAADDAQTYPNLNLNISVANLGTIQFTGTTQSQSYYSQAMSWVSSLFFKPNESVDNNSTPPQSTNSLNANV